MYWAAFTTPFFGLMRVSEFAAVSNTSFDQRTLCGRDVQLNDDLVVLHLLVSKSDPYHKGFDVVLAPTGGLICSVRVFHWYWKVRWMDVGIPLFCFQSGAFLSRDRRSSQLRLLLDSIGMDSMS